MPLVKFAKLVQRHVHLSDTEICEVIDGMQLRHPELVSWLVACSCVAEARACVCACKHLCLCVCLCLCLCLCMHPLCCVDTDVSGARPIRQSASERTNARTHAHTHARLIPGNRDGDRLRAIHSVGDGNPLAPPDGHLPRLVLHRLGTVGCHAWCQQRQHQQQQHQQQQ